MDRSLVFFYCMWAIFFTYFTLKFVKEKNKWPCVALNLSLIISLVFASFFYDLSTGMWFLVVIVSTAAIFLTSLLIIIMLKQHLIVKYVQRKINQLQSLPPADMIEFLIKDNPKKNWYVLYFPVNNSVEIGVNLLDSELIVGQSTHIKTLTNKVIRFIPGDTSQEKDLKNSVIYNLQEFYSMSCQTKALAESYILGIKDTYKKSVDT